MLDSHQHQHAGAEIATLKTDSSVHQEVSTSLAVCVFALSCKKMSLGSVPRFSIRLASPNCKLVTIIAGCWRSMAG